MDPNNNRLHLNFGFNDRTFSSANSRAYPTTPSGFPHPIYQSPGTQEFVDPHAAPNVYSSPGYFMSNPYAPQPPQQAHYAQQQYAQHSLQSPQPAYSSRMPYNTNDGTNGLIQQFSNHDLGASPRGRLSPGAASPAQGRGAGSPAPSQQHLAPPMASRGQKPQGDDEELQRYPERYSENVHKRGKAAKELVNVFFQENIERARDRNIR
jgi:protein-serine/threonine kinase